MRKRDPAVLRRASWMVVQRYGRWCERECQSVLARRDLQGQRHRPVSLSHLAVPTPPAGDHRRRLRRAATLENAGRPALIHFLTAPQPLHRFTLRDVVRGSQFGSPHATHLLRVIECNRSSARELLYFLCASFLILRCEFKRI